MYRGSADGVLVAQGLLCSNPQSRRKRRIYGAKAVAPAGFLGGLGRKSAVSVMMPRSRAEDPCLGCYHCREMSTHRKAGLALFTNRSYANAHTPSMNDTWREVCGRGVQMV